MQQVPSLLLLIGAVVIVAGLGRVIFVLRKRNRRRAYFRDRAARVRQQWTDLEAMDDKRRR